MEFMQRTNTFHWRSEYYSRDHGGNSDMLCLDLVTLTINCWSNSWSFFLPPHSTENQRDSGCSAATLLLIVRSSENKQHQGCCGECSARNTNPRTIVLETCKQGPRSMLKNKAFTCKLVAAKHKHVAETPGLLKNVHNARKLSGNLKAKTEGFHTRQKKMHEKDNGWHNILV